MSEPGQVTIWLRRLHDGDDSALDRLVPLLYDELRQQARRRLRMERSGHTLDSVGLVNEVYLKLLGQRRLNAADRSQFFAIAGNTMRRILVDHARRKKRLKRGGDVPDLSLEEWAGAMTVAEASELVALDDALDRLSAINPRGSQVVQYRFFSGLTLDEIAQVMDVSSKTVQRAWTAARAWLRKEVSRELERGGAP